MNIQCGVGYMGEHCKKSIFLFGTISITIISLTSLAGAVLAPLRSWKYYPDLQSGMIALAVGCLSGDAILHLIPIIFGLHGHAHAEKDHDDHDHDDHDHEGHGCQVTVCYIGYRIYHPRSFAKLVSRNL